MIMVAGLARSGTSAVSRVLETVHGVDMGGPGRVRPENPHGTYERDWQVLADQSLMGGSMNTRQWSWAIQPHVYALTEPFGLKHPFNAGFFQLYVALYPNASIVWVRRDLDAVRASWRRCYPQWGEGRIERTVEQHERNLHTVLSPLSTVVVDMTERRTDEEIADAVQGVL